MKPNIKRLAILILGACLLTIFMLNHNKEMPIESYGLANKAHSAIIPVEQTLECTRSWWMPRHEQILQQIALGKVELVWIGDSITHRWESNGRATWNHYYAPRNAANLGIDGDRTQHVLWRLNHGEIDGIKPKLAIVLIGTNNTKYQTKGTANNSAEEIADGIKAICAEIRTKLPKTKILILAILPRADVKQFDEAAENDSINPLWAKNNRANKLVSEIADNKIVYYLDVNHVFLDENGNISREMMPDFLHPSPEGYKILAESIEPTVAKLMGE